jgi:hypothetical protein
MGHIPCTLRTLSFTEGVSLGNLVIARGERSRYSTSKRVGSEAGFHNRRSVSDAVSTNDIEFALKCTSLNRPSVLRIFPS